MVVPPQNQKLNDTENLVKNDTFASSMTARSNSTSNSLCKPNTNKKMNFGFEGKFYWSCSQVGFALGAFFYAYIPIQVLAGVLADKFGIRHVIGIGVLTGGILIGIGVLTGGFDALNGYVILLIFVSQWLR